MKYWLLTLGLLSFTLLMQSQVVYEHISNGSVYTFLDELATSHLIDIQTAVKPFSRKQIAGWLAVADENKSQLSRSQQQRLSTFLREYSLELGVMKTGKINIIHPTEKSALYLLPPELVWSDSMLKAVFRPIYGIRYISNENASFYHSYGGAEMMAYAGERWGAYASVRDNHQSGEPLSLPLYLTTEPGGNYKNGSDYSEMRGGITYEWKWGSFGFIKDHVQWGDNANGSNIFSGRTPSFPMVKLQIKLVKWLEFNYFHGWLVSQVIDSSRSYYTSNGDFRGIFRQKYIAANMYTFKPFKNLNLSLGNSIVYSDVPVQPAYLIPFFFFKSLDHTLNKGIDNQNSAMFLNVNSRQIKHLELYSSLFIDELSFSRIGDPLRHNFYSIKVGGSLMNWPFKNASLRGEFTQTSPMTYKHRIPSTTFETNEFNLGHYLKDNSQEVFVSLSWFPVSSLNLKLSYTNAFHGNEYQYVFGGVPVDENPVLAEKSWSNESIRLRAEMMPLPNLQLFAEFQYSQINGYALDGYDAGYYLNRFGPTYLHGKNNTFMAGFAFGL